jgi:Family of unknown function (DUF5990)
MTDRHRARLATMKLIVFGTDLPGRTFCAPDGTPLDNVHVGLQISAEPENLVPGDAADARSELEIVTAMDSDGQLDFRGHAVHGRPGDRFIYLTWGNVDDAGAFHMFRRAKLMLNRVDPVLMRDASERGHLSARVRLTDDRGGPRCARVDPPSIIWNAD